MNFDPNTTATMFVDLENDFMPEHDGRPAGSLAVAGAHKTVAPLAELAERTRVVVFTRDNHPADHMSFASQGRGGPWPDHGVAGTFGAEYHPEVAELIDTHSADEAKRVVLIDKGTHVDFEAYSAFQGTDLADQLRADAVRTLLIGGVATDVCVEATVIDGVNEGFEVIVVREGCRAVDLDPGDGERAFERMAAAGAQVVSVDELVGAAA